MAASGCATFEAGPGSLDAKREVRASRLLAREVDEAVSHNRLRSLRESVACDRGSLVIQATLFTDGTGRPRKYALEGGTGDSAHYVFYYYDTAGRLRLIDSDQRGANKSQRTSHYYYDTAGKLVHKDERKSGPGWPFPESSERRDPVSDIRTLADPEGCRRVSDPR